MYVKLENNIPVKWPVSEYELRRQFPKKSLPEKISEKCAKELGYGLFVFNGYPSDFDATYQNIEEVAPVLIDGKYNQSYKITEKYSPEEKKKLQDDASKQRNKLQAEMLLQQTDWTATVDIANPTYSVKYLTNQNEFLAYRSLIREIAVNPPVIVESWPAVPKELWSN